MPDRYSTFALPNEIYPRIIPGNEKTPRRSRRRLTLVGEHSGIPEQSSLGRRGALAAEPDRNTSNLWTRLRCVQ